jgi:hypothetical protein
MFDKVTISLHYSRAGRHVSWCALAAASVLAALPAFAQYPGQIEKQDKDAHEMRAVGVLEWTGEAGKPKTSRLVPVTVFDGDQLQDGSIYLARPQPLAVQGGVEYILQKNGGKVGLFEIEAAGRVEGSWVGFGKWKTMPSAAPQTLAKVAPAVDEEASDKPTLHRKTHTADSGSSSGNGGDTSSAPASPTDPDRPTLHKKPASDDGSGANPSSAPASTQTAGGASTDDPDRPVLKKGKPQPQAQTGHVEDMPSAVDPNRPKLQRGKSDGGVGSVETPTLVGMPVDMKQMVAVSDARNKPEHPWGYSWADPADELKMKAQLEQVARQALGLAPTPTKAKTTTAKAKRTPVLQAPAPLTDEQFRVFELAYGSGATLVLTARTDGPPEKQKFVTLIAQPDLYGNLLVLFKSVTDGEHLDDTPRMRLVDAVDAMADNRGELLFELQGERERQFALFRVMRGTAEKLFVTGGGASGSQAMN